MVNLFIIGIHASLFIVNTRSFTLSVVADSAFELVPDTFLSICFIQLAVVIKIIEQSYDFGNGNFDAGTVSRPLPVRHFCHNFVYFPFMSDSFSFYFLVSFLSFYPWLEEHIQIAGTQFFGWFDRIKN
jgi:hypothetical protein